MPRLVDHDLRRSEVVKLTTRLLLEAGIFSVTLRDIASAAGCSTAIISHYFRDKRELFLLMYREANAAGARDVAEVEARDPGDLQGCLEVLLPLDEPRRDRCRVWLSFGALCASDLDFAEEYIANSAHCRAGIARFLAHRVRAGRLPADLDLDKASHRLLALVQGVMAQAVADPKSWPAARQSAMLAEEIAMLDLQR